MNINLNELLNAALTQSVASAIQPIVQANVELRDRVSALEDQINILVSTISKAATEAAEAAMELHNQHYVHDDFVTDVSEAVEACLNDMNLAEYIDVHDQITDAVRNLSFTVEVS
jgi:hypothetical protein